MAASAKAGSRAAGALHVPTGKRLAIRRYHAEPASAGGDAGVVRRKATNAGDRREGAVPLVLELLSPANVRQQITAIWPLSAGTTARCKNGTLSERLAGRSGQHSARPASSKSRSRRCRAASCPPVGFNETLNDLLLRIPAGQRQPGQGFSMLLQRLPGPQACCSRSTPAQAERATAPVAEPASRTRRPMRRQQPKSPLAQRLFPSQAEQPVDRQRQITRHRPGDCIR